VTSVLVVDSSMFAGFSDSLDLFRFPMVWGPAASGSDEGADDAAIVLTGADMISVWPSDGAIVAARLERDDNNEVQSGLVLDTATRSWWCLRSRPRVSSPPLTMQE
jgi:hypothetical protein